MQSLPFQQAQQSLDAICQKACQDHEPYIINRDDDNHVVILSLADYNALQETHYLLSTPNNAAHLLHSLEQARNGQLSARELLAE